MSDDKGDSIWAVIHPDGSKIEVNGKVILDETIEPKIEDLPTPVDEDRAEHYSKQEIGGTEMLCDIAPGWTCALDQDDGVLIIAHPMSVPLAIPLNSIKAGDKLPRLDDFVKYRIRVAGE